MTTQEITCPMCGFKNRSDAARCRSCGAKVEALVALYTEEEVQKKRYQQEAFEWKWAGAAFGIYLALQTVVLLILPLMISAYDPQGIGGVVVSLAVWFLGGIGVGWVSPHKTFVEPAAGALLAVMPTIGFLALRTPPGFQPTLLAYIVGGMLGVMIALFGAFVGEKIQMVTRGHAGS
jgi:DNA-directed RNA polymerase subunit RPC12/RpoP